MRAPGLFKVAPCGQQRPISTRPVKSYRERANTENPFDELKNQWGWAGLTTRDFERGQIMARLIALVYNWWSLFVWLVDRQRYREAATSRPILLGGIARQTEHAGQNRLHLESLSQAQTDKIKEKLTDASLPLRGILAACGAIEFYRTLETHFGQDF